MKLIRNLAIGLAVIAAVLVAVGFLLPRSASVARSVEIKAPAHTVYTVLTSYRSFEKWSPWGELDNAMTITHEGPPVGVGAKMSWSSTNANVGSGSQEIIAADPDKSLTIKLDFGGNGGGESTWTLSPVEGGTKVTWGFSTDLGSNPIARYFGLALPSLVGADYEKGLAKLKTFVEALPPYDFSGTDIQFTAAQSQLVLMTRTLIANSGPEMTAALEASFKRLGETAARLGIAQATDAYPISIASGVEGNKVQLDAALPIESISPDVKLPAGITVEETYDGKAIRAAHLGSYDKLDVTYMKLIAFLAAVSAEGTGPSWNEYVSDPAATPPEEVLTNIYLPVK